MRQRLGETVSRVKKTKQTDDHARQGPAQKQTGQAMTKTRTGEKKRKDEQGQKVKARIGGKKRLMVGESRKRERKRRRVRNTGQG